MAGGTRSRVVTRGAALRGAVPAVLLSLVLGGCSATVVPPGTLGATPGHGVATTPPGSPAPGASAAASTPGPATAQAATVLAHLAVKARAARSAYSRAFFGDSWADPAGDGCDTREDILRRDLTQVQLRRGALGCIVEGGLLADPYTGTAITFERGVVTSRDVQIDHVVSLFDAWRTGAQSWTAQRRLAFANDALNLLAVSGRANLSKGDADAAGWLPPNKRFRCSFVARQIAVKARYGLWVTPGEHDAMARVLSSCPGQLTPS